MVRSEVKAIDARVKELVLEAQAASMAAKKAWPASKIDFYESMIKAPMPECREYYYSIKSNNILKALRLLQRAKHSHVAWRIERKPDQNGHDSNVIYFEWAEKDGEKIQFSFHQPGAPFAVKGDPKIIWDGEDCKAKYYALRTR